jgi:hypothetical protein
MKANRYISYGDKDSRKPLIAIREDKPVNKSNNKQLVKNLLLSRTKQLTDWEIKFFSNIISQTFPVTDKQAAIIEKVSKKHVFKK